ncbi:MAG: hypothetical protein JSW11_08000 [Candidatus Heimdallarchaeota archaeon]|nr:MAG: hypothetical protein JSW11_08000 [Candidatus Heimdallarchaeota archaeon]
MKEISRFEPLFTDILPDDINEQHARILVLMFRLGGFTTLNLLTDFLPFLSQPTVSIRVAELVNKGYLRKNPELMPMALVLMLTTDTLESQLERKFEVQQNAFRFLLKTLKISDKFSLKEMFIQAIQALYPKRRKFEENLAKEDVLPRLVAFIYLYKIIPRNDLYELVYGKKYPIKIAKKYDSIISAHPEIFHVVYKKHQYKETLIRPQLPLDSFVKNRLTYLESLYSYYKKLLEELGNFLTGEYEAIIPHQLLYFPSEIKFKIEVCLKHYKTIRVIDNAIYVNKEGITGVLSLVIDRQNFTPDHKVLMFANTEIQLPDNVNQSQIQFFPLKTDIPRDYKSRDFILFEEHGCLVFPSQPNAIPYYNIAPRFTTSLLNIFQK